VSFSWRDRDGQSHDLAGFEPIVAEAESISREIDDLVALIESEERMIRDPARALLQPLQARLEELGRDVARWNGYASAETRRAADALLREIDALLGKIAVVALVVAVHDEHQRMMDVTLGAPKTRADILAAGMTFTQQRAIAACKSRTPPPKGASRAEAKTWLDRQPMFARASSVEGGWFAWIDRHGHAHRLLDSLPIEREVVALAADLSAMRASLGNTDDPVALYSAVETASGWAERLSDLQDDLERFDREAEARDLAECKAYAADWRAKRTKP
jgi:hypothetical protein